MENLKNESIISINNGAYIFIKNYYETNAANVYFKKLFTEIEWRQEAMFMFGKKINFPRLMAYYGDGASYRFSRKTFAPSPWIAPLSEIRHDLESDFHYSFNSVLANLYRHQMDSMSWHQDDEKEMGKNPIIASVNFGATRQFEMRHIQTKEKIKFDLEHGSLLIMLGETQHYWQHQLPKLKRPLGSRINLTYRLMK